MKNIIYPVVFALAWTVGQGAVQADGPWQLFDGCSWSMPSLHALWKARKCWCPNDYCAKALPCPPPCVHGCCDDYCAKSLPCPPPWVKGCCDDYCPRCCPLWLGKLCEPWYRCGPPDRCEACCNPCTH